MTDSLNKYLRKAKSILNANWTGSYTMPARQLYPHQWNWDSGFIAIGYSHYNTERAIGELTSLFKAQWKNGMVPQIVFNKKTLGNYFPEPDFWQTSFSPNAPTDILTSGITMPPIHAVAALAIYKNAKRPHSVLQFLKWIYPRLITSHRYLYKERDPDDIGLVYIRHPWESGMDNSPMWDFIFKKIDMNLVKIPPYQRKDFSKGVRSETRPQDKDYDRFVYLVDIFRRHKYDEETIRRNCPFLVYGPLFNSILCASNEALIKIAKILGEPHQEAEEWYSKTKKAISERLYNEGSSIFNYFDLVNGELVDIDTAAGFLPLYCGAASSEQASMLYNHLNSKSFCSLYQGNCYTIPNYDTQKEGFQRQNYWRGPVWININWLLMHGLRRYGFIQKADSVAKDILQLPIRFGFYEYYDSSNGMGYGSSDFSWTASLFIDTAYENYEKIGEKTMIKRLKNIMWRTSVLNDSEEVAEILFERLSQEMLSTIKNIKGKYYTDNGVVDYASIKESKEYEKYKGLTARLRDYDLCLLKGDKEIMAFWLNLYNTLVVEGIIALGVKQSVKEAPGFFSMIKYKIGDLTFSPDDIEHGILRANARHPARLLKQFRPFDKRTEFRLKKVDPRIHFALTCGSRSCAPIKFYSPEGITTELDLAAKNFINSSDVIVLPEEKRIIISKIFKWYKKDFGGRDGILDFIEKHLVDDDKKVFIKNEKMEIIISYLHYDWSLNA
ncbi:MAG: MGH1-like glycoside hydrolase domain-containing protein [Candidatus Anammoxibacter sp.]